MQKLSFLALIGLLACNETSTETITPRNNEDVRPAVTGLQPLGYISDFLGDCADGPAATDGPVLQLHYSELLPPNQEHQVMILELRGFVNSKRSECIRETILEHGGVEAGSTGGDESGEEGTTG